MKYLFTANFYLCFNNDNMSQKSNKGGLPWYMEMWCQSSSKRFPSHNALSSVDLYLPCARHVLATC